MKDFKNERVIALSGDIGEDIVYFKQQVEKAFQDGKVAGSKQARIDTLDEFKKEIRMLTADYGDVERYIDTELEKVRD